MSFKFNAMQLIIRSETPKISDLKLIFDKLEEGKFNTNNKDYFITKNYENGFYWLYAQSGDKLPYSDEVYNVVDNKREGNPRNEDQIELSSQCFCLYSEKYEELLISSSKIKNFIPEYFKSIIKKDVVIKNFYLNENEFLNKIKKIKSIKLVSKNDLFKKDTGLFEAIDLKNDIFGMGYSDSIELKVNYKLPSPTDRFKEIFPILEKKYSLDKLICIGIDDSNFESVFNANNFTKKINIELSHDDKGMYDPDDVKRMIISKINRKKTWKLFTKI